MKKVVVINGSPSPVGYTMRIVKIFEENLKTIDSNIDIQYIHLINEELKHCIGCCRCLSFGGHKCPLKDNVPKILEKMQKADAIVFASPGYAHMVTGLYKNFMDRFMYLDHLNDIQIVGKTAIIISTSGGEEVNRPAKYMANMGIIWWGCNLTDILGIASGFFMMNKKYEQKIRKRLKKAAKKFHTELQKEKPRKPDFRQYLYFMFNKTENQIAGDVNPYRMKIWIENNWMNTDYYYKTFVNPLYKIASVPMFALMKLLYKIMLGNDAHAKISRYMRARY